MKISGFIASVAEIFAANAGRCSFVAIPNFRVTAARIQIFVANFPGGAVAAWICDSISRARHDAPCDWVKGRVRPAFPCRPQFNRGLRGFHGFDALSWGRTAWLASVFFYFK
jgi:hypothetical protein